MSDPELDEMLREGLLREDTIRLAYLYGSAILRTDFRDVDVAVWGPVFDAMLPAARTDLLLRLGATLERHVRPRRHLDLQVLNGAPLPLQYEVVRTGRLLLARSEIERIRYEAWLASISLDFQRGLRLFDDALLAGIP